MPYLYIAIVTIAVFVLMHQFTELNMRQKGTVAVVLFVLIVSFYFFEDANKRQAKETQLLRYAFEQGRSLVCEDKIVSKELYNYASRSFIGKKGTTAFGTPNIAISSCKIQP